MENLEQKNKPENPVLEHHTLLFLLISAIYAVGFATAFYQNFAGLTFPLITIGTLAVCGLFLKKSGIVWKRENFFYVPAILLLGISTMLTTNFFILFFNTAGILLLLTIFMLHQFHDDGHWNPIQYLCNILFFYVCMIPSIASPFVNLGKYIRSKRVREEKNKNVKYVLFGVLLGIPMVIFTVLLLSSADAVFSKYVGNGFQFLWDNFVLSPNIILILFLIMFGFLASYSFLSALTLNNMPEWKEKKEKKNPVTALTFTGMVTVIYLIFCGIQGVFLFTGGMVLPKGYTYAEYAHQGFFQLLFVCIFNFILVLFCLSIFQMNRLLKQMLTVFSGCSVVMILSAAFRMILYISVYHLSFLRVLVLWFLVLLLLLMAGVIIAIWKKEFPIFGYTLVTVTLCYLILSFGRMDYWIAKYNISQMEHEIGVEDLSYLCSLSWDAVPALTKIDLNHQNPEHDDKNRNYQCPACLLEYYFKSIKEHYHLNVRGFNLSGYQALQAAEEYLK